jgi:thiol-disulfide isomerase/thioredoxin
MPLPPNSNDESSYTPDAPSSISATDCASETAKHGAGRALLAVLLLAGLSLAAAGLFTLARPVSALRGSSKPLPRQQDSQLIIRLVGHPEPAPAFELPSLDGKPVSLESAKGKIVLLNFWATWCGPCRMEMPALIALQTKYKDALQIIGLAVDVDDPHEVKDYVQESGITFPVAVASDAVRVQYGGIMALPTTFVLDTEGRIVQKHVGLADPLLFELEIRALLHLAIPAKVETFEDTGQIFLKNADRATELPGVDFSKLSAEQRQTALRAFNAEACTCGCKLTLAQCRIYDSACRTSLQRTAEIVASIASGKSVKPHAAAPPAGTASSPSTPLR